MLSDTMWALWGLNSGRLTSDALPLGHHAPKEIFIKTVMGKFFWKFAVP